MGEHNKLLLALIILTPIAMVAAYIFNGLTGVDIPIFKNTTTALSNKYDTRITPSGWTFSIWGFIYAWQVLWVLFAIINIFRKTPDGPAYTSPIILTPLFFIIYILNSLLNLAWNVLFGNERIIIAFVALFLIAFTLYICLFIAYRNLYISGPVLQKQERNLEIWLHRILVQNGLAIYATWTTIATLLNMIITMVYGASPGVDIELSGTVALGILTAELVVFVVTDIFFFDNYSRYTFTPYIVVPVALGGSIDKNWDKTNTNSIFSAVLLGISLACAVLKVIAILWRHTRKPFYATEIAPTTEATKPV